MSPKCFSKLSHPELEISLYLSNISKEVSQLKDWQTYKKFTIIGKQRTNIQGMSPKSFKKIFHLELEISLYLSNFSKEVSQKTNWKTCKKFRFIWNKCANIPGVCQKVFINICHPEVEISLYWPNISIKVANYKTDRTQKKYYLEILYNYPRNIEKKCKKIS